MSVKRFMMMRCAVLERRLLLWQRQSQVQEHEPFGFSWATRRKHVAVSLQQKQQQQQPRRNSSSNTPLSSSLLYKPLPPMPRVMPPLTTMGKPPMPRVLPRVAATTRVAAESTNTVTKGRIRTWWENGNILIYVGWTGLALFALDRYLQRLEQQEAMDLVRQLGAEQEAIRAKLLLDHAHQPALYRARVLQEYRKMGGSHGLKWAQKDMMLDVLQEHVGPDRLYHLCRLYKTQPQQAQENATNPEVLSVGWFPAHYLQRIDTNGVPISHTTKDMDDNTHEKSGGGWIRFLIPGRTRRQEQQQQQQQQSSQGAVESQNVALEVVGVKSSK